MLRSGLGVRPCGPSGYWLLPEWFPRRIERLDTRLVSLKRESLTSLRDQDAEPRDAGSGTEGDTLGKKGDAAGAQENAAGTQIILRTYLGIFGHACRVLAAGGGSIGPGDYE